MTAFGGAAKASLNETRPATNGPALLSNHTNACYVRIAIRMMMGSGMPSSSSSIERIVFSLN